MIKLAFWLFIAALASGLMSASGLFDVIEDGLRWCFFASCAALGVCVTRALRTV